MRSVPRRSATGPMTKEHMRWYRRNMTTSPAARRLIVVALLAAIMPVTAQQANRTGTSVAALHEQIDRIFVSRAYEAPRFGPARWLPDGTAYAIVERKDGGSEIARYDAAAGSRTVLVSASKLVPTGMKTGLEIDDY